MSHVAVIGGGVIGGGWAARFLLMGHEVRLYDPAPGPRHGWRRCWARPGGRCR